MVSPDTFGGGVDNVSLDTKVQLARTRARDVIELPSKPSRTFDSTRRQKEFLMYTARKFFGALAGCAVLIGSVAFVGSVAGAGPDKYSVKVPGRARIRRVQGL